jgi:branched-chain amino acid aminotransferase
VTPLLINFNGELVAADSRLLTIANRGFKYGDGLFESMRLMKGQLKFAELHADRLQRSMKLLKIDGYSQLDTWLDMAGYGSLYIATPTDFTPPPRIKWDTAWS